MKQRKRGGDPAVRLEQRLEDRLENIDQNIRVLADTQTQILTNQTTVLQTLRALTQRVVDTGIDSQNAGETRADMRVADVVARVAMALAQTQKCL